MPRRDDLKKILIIGSGPIVIGQACEFDYSGTQACKALREEGYQVVLVNSNPATIMTDPSTADRTYIEPLTWEIVAKVIERERPDALLPTLGGQTALNLAMALDKHGVLEKFGVEMIGANADVIDKAESRDRFQQAMQKIGLDLPRGRTVRNLDEARVWIEEIGLPAVVRPSFTMGGSGSAIAYNLADYEILVRRDPRDRRRDRRLEHPVCDPSENRPNDRHRDESACEPLQRAGVEGNGISDCQDRGQAGSWISAPRAAQRHHPRHDRLLRADD